MADLSITAATTVNVSGTAVDGVLGETCTAGQVVYLKAADNRLWLAQTDGTSAQAAAVGVLLNGGGAGQPAKYVTEGAMTLAGATTAVGVVYYVSNAFGGICPIGDIGSADYVSVIGFATSVAGAFTVRIINTGQVLA